MKFQGLDIVIEVEKGESDEPEEGNWNFPMSGMTRYLPYGYIKRTMGNDEEEIDVFIGPDETSDKVFIFHLMKPEGAFDEQKVLLGFNSAEEAAKFVSYQYPATAEPVLLVMTMEDFKEDLKRREPEFLKLEREDSGEEED